MLKDPRMDKPRLTVGTMRVLQPSPAPGKLMLADDPQTEIKTRGGVLVADVAIEAAKLLVEAAALAKGYVLLTFHYNGTNPINGYHSTVLIPHGQLKDPSIVPIGEPKYLGHFRASKLVPRSKGSSASVGLKLTAAQCLKLAGYLLLGAGQLLEIQALAAAGETRGRKYVCVTCFSHCGNKDGFHTSVTLE
jgi:hypothetical protein